MYHSTLCIDLFKQSSHTIQIQDVLLCLLEILFGVGEWGVGGVTMSIILPPKSHHICQLPDVFLIGNYVFIYANSSFCPV